MVAMKMRESVTTGGKERRADIVNEQFCTTAEDTPKTYRITTIDHRGELRTIHHQADV